MTQPAWNRGDDQPDRRRLDEALDRILEHCRPVEVILFGSAARGELQDSSGIDLLVVLADGDSAEPERMCFDICEAIGCQPRADVAVAFEKEVREAASAWPAPCTPGLRKDPALPPRLAAGLRARARPAAATGERCPDRRVSWQEADWLWERTREELGLAEQCRDRLVARFQQAVDPRLPAQLPERRADVVADGSAVMLQVHNRAGPARLYRYAPTAPRPPSLPSSFTAAALLDPLSSCSKSRSRTGSRTDTRRRTGIERGRTSKRERRSRSRSKRAPEVDPISCPADRVHLWRMSGAAAQKKRTETPSRSVRTGSNPAQAGRWNLIRNEVRNRVRRYGLFCTSSIYGTGYTFWAEANAILVAGGGAGDGGGLAPASLAAVAAVERLVDIKVFVTTSCTFCPLATGLAYRLAAARRYITAAVIEATEFPDMVQCYRVSGVPKTVVDDRVELLGVHPEETFVRKCCRLHRTPRQRPALPSRSASCGRTRGLTARIARAARPVSATAITPRRGLPARRRDPACRETRG